MSLLLRMLAPAPTPENGPSGGARWLDGYAPRFGYRRPSAAKRRARRNEFIVIF